MIKSVFWGVLAIYLPGGLGIPLMTAMRVNGVVSTAYGIFEWDEGIQKQELGNIGDVTADNFNFGSDVICLGYDGVYHTIGEVSVFISKLDVSNVLWGYAARAFNSVTGTIKGLTKRIVRRKNVVGGAKAGTSILVHYGDDFGKMGTYVENPGIVVDWEQYAAHGVERMQQRGMTREIVDRIVENGKVLSQNNGSRFAYITNEGVVIVSKEGRLITAWSNMDFDSNMLEIIEKLFGK